ncbi:hypothetical protein ACHAP7_011425 [Fusarium lateritium]
MVAFKSLVVLLALCTQASAMLATNVICASELGTVSVASNKIPRATTTIQNKITVVKRAVRKVNFVVVPRAKTTTQIDTTKTTVKTIANPDVETAVHTVTSDQTTTIIRRSIVTSVTTSSTTTTLHSATTVGKPAGFIPIVEGGGYVAKRKCRAALEDKIDRAIDFSESSYVQRVDCTKRIPCTSVQTTTTTIQGPRKTLPAKMVIKKSTTTKTIIETEYSATVVGTDIITVYPTIAEYNDIKETSIFTVIVTVQSIVPREAVYEVFGANNIISSANGGHGFSGYHGTGPSFHSDYIAEAVTARLCCEACMTHPNCLHIVFSSEECLLYLARADDACPNGQVPSNYFTTSTSPVSEEDGWTMSNGPCGVVGNGGDS